MPGAALAWVLAGQRLLGGEGEQAALEPDLSGLASDPTAVVSRRVYAGILQRAVARNPAFAVEAGHRLAFGTFPLLDCTTAAAPTLRAAIHALDRYFALVTRNGRWRLEGDRLELCPLGPLPPWFRIASFEFGVHYTAARFDELAGAQVVRRLEVDWPAPSWADRYPRPTTFSASRVALVLDPAALDAPSRRADPLVSELLARNAAAALDARPRCGGAERQVVEALTRLLPSGLPRMADVARELGSSPRSLRRRLAEEGLTFEALRDETLRALALERLENPRVSVAEVAYLLGFSEARAFHRAFRRWTGVTPGQFRKRGPPASAAEARRPRPPSTGQG